MQAILTIILEGNEEELTDIKANVINVCANNITTVKYDVIKESQEIKIPKCILKR